MTGPDAPSMIMRHTDEGECPRCGGDLRYGVKEEPSSWKVYFDCVTSECPWECFAGRVRRADVDHVDEVYEAAEGFHTRI